MKCSGLHWRRHRAICEFIQNQMKSITLSINFIALQLDNSEKKSPKKKLQMPTNQMTAVEISALEVQEEEGLEILEPELLITAQETSMELGTINSLFLYYIVMMYGQFSTMEPEEKYIHLMASFHEDDTIELFIDIHRITSLK